jgi:hypothetical protein
MIVVVVGAAMVVVMIVPVAAGRVAALTGRLGPHSTAGLAMVAATVLAGADLREVVRDDHPQLRGERRLVGGPVRERGAEAGPGLGVGFRHAPEPTASRGRCGPVDGRRGRVRPWRLHTLEVLPGNTEPTETLTIVHGMTEYLARDGSVVATSDAASTLRGYDESCEAAGLSRPDLVLTESAVAGPSGAGCEAAAAGP